MQFSAICVKTNSILVLCTEHQLTCSCQSFNHTVKVFIFRHFIIQIHGNQSIYKYIDKFTNVFKYSSIQCKILEGRTQAKIILIKKKKSKCCIEVLFIINCVCSKSQKRHCCKSLKVYYYSDLIILCDSFNWNFIKNIRVTNY